MIDEVPRSEWELDAVERARRLYPKGLQDAAAVMARSGRYAIQYMEQAPALIAFSAWGAVPRTGKEQSYLAQRWGSAIYRNPPLKKLLHELGAPLQVRQISARACFPSYLPIIFQLRGTPPSVLAQAIPEKPGPQRWWLGSLWLVKQYQLGHGLREHGPLWPWAIQALGAAAPRHKLHLEWNVADLLDMLSRTRTQINPRWTFEQALGAAARWHETLAREATEKDTLKAMGYDFDHRFDYQGIPDEIELDGFTFTALRSGLELFREGQAMRHCVASYAHAVAAGATFIVTVRKGERRIATVQLSNGARLHAIQVRGPCNAQVPKAAQAAIDRYAEKVTGLRAEEMKRRRAAEGTTILSARSIHRRAGRPSPEEEAQRAARFGEIIQRIVRPEDI